MNRKKKMNQRLIDANKIEFNTVRYPIGLLIGQPKEERAMGEYEFISKYQIENQPTVEAIPIEWLEKKIAELYETLKPCITENGEIAPATADDLLKYYPFSVLLDAYEKVLENWRKENEMR